MKYLTLFLISLGLLFSCGKKDAGGHEAHDEQAGHDDHEGHGHAAGESVDLSSQALANMGVKMKRAKLSSYTIFTPVPAVVKAPELNEQPVFAPFKGRVQKIEVTIGEYREPGEVLISLIRAPIARPELKMVGDILTPASEEYHSTIAELRTSVKSLEVLDSELKRLKAFDTNGEGISLVPQKDLIDLKYNKAKAEQQISNFRNKLILHGLTKKEINKIAQGETINRSPNFWLNALKQNNIWNKKASSLYNVLPPKLKDNRWTLATVGELSATELISDESIAWLSKDIKAAAHFLEIASLLQSGHTLTDIKDLYQIGALEKIISVKAPLKKMGWDVEKIHIKIGQEVEAGQPLLTLSNHSTMHLIAKPQASEIGLLNEASKLQSSISAVPLVKGSGIDIHNLTVNKIVGDDDGTSLAYVEVTNSVHSSSSKTNKNYRNWNLRNGLKYVLQIPQRILTDVIVLPSEAVIQHGPDKIAFIKDHGEFVRRKVVVVYQNNEVVVISKDSEIKIKDLVVQQGAFALQLAFIAGTPEALAPHAGHSH
ncbi:MAG: hypothetical protein HRT88_05195 [Lentisphaeraceae bacterium]|nr:hypothetical protein [Lentisphaeraceae bacterium]